MELETVKSPVFPVERDADVAQNAQPLVRTSKIEVFVHLAEPVLYLQGFAVDDSTRTAPAVLRGSLVVRILKPTKLKGISLSFKGYTRTQWPEGIPPTRQDFVESNSIVEHVWPFYDSENPPTRPSDRNRTTSEWEQLAIASGASMVRELPNSAKNNGSHSRHTTPSNSYTNIASAAKSGGSSENRSNAFDNKKRSPSSATLDSNISAHSSSLSMNPMTLFKRTTTGQNSTKKLGKTNNNSSSLSMISDFFSGNNNSISNRKSSSNLDKYHQHNGLSLTHSTDTFTFQPGDYIYAFEQIVPNSYPESITVEYGSTEYILLVSIERVGAFKSNINARYPVTIVRTPLPSSVEENEPIVISKEWEHQLYYDIVVASKDIVLDGFLPVSIKFYPLDKVTLHRVRIYVTESVEYYCRGKKVHRVEPTKKYLLLEQKGPQLEPLEHRNSSKVKAKYLGNLLVDEKTGDIVNKTLEYQVYAPANFGSRQKLHPDTSYTTIKTNHWIKICLRLSKEVDKERKHYEITIGSPIHILHKLCCHANTLLPSYGPDPHIVSENMNSSNVVEGVHHDSNIFFPKEFLNSSILSSELPDSDSVWPSYSKPATNRQQKNTTIQGSANKVEHTKYGKMSDLSLFDSPKLRSNIYMPDSVQRQLAFPQAVPLSPFTSPCVSPIVSPIGSPTLSPVKSPDNDDTPPPPDFRTSQESKIHASLIRSIDHANAPLFPPPYKEIHTIVHRTSSPTFVVHENQDNEHERFPTYARQEISEHPSTDDGMHVNINHELRSVLSSKSSSSSRLNLEDLHDSNPSYLRLANNLGRPPSAPLSYVDLMKLHGRHDPLNENLPSTVRNSGALYMDMNQLLSEPEDEEILDGNVLNDVDSVSNSGVPSFDRTHTGWNPYESTCEPLREHSDTVTIPNVDANISSFFDDSLQECNMEESVDITEFNERDSPVWHPDEQRLSPSMLSNNDLSFDLADNHGAGRISPSILADDSMLITDFPKSHEYRSQIGADENDNTKHHNVNNSSIY